MPGTDLRQTHGSEADGDQLFSRSFSTGTRRSGPLLGVYYLTYACSFRCPHCGDGSGTPYHRLRSPVLPATDVLRLLARLRRYTDWLVL